MGFVLGGVVLLCFVWFAPLPTLVTMFFTLAWPLIVCHWVPSKAVRALVWVGGLIVSAVLSWTFITSEAFSLFCPIYWCGAIAAGIFGAGEGEVFD